MRALFLTWDGSQQTYLESLFFPIFARLRPLGVEVQVLQLTWASPAELMSTERAAHRFGISYTSRRVSRRLGLAGQLGGIALGASLAVRYVRERNVDVLFPRSLLPAAMALLALPRLRGVKLVFDADGLMADERVEFAGWSAQGAPYRVLRKIEASTLRRAASVITRTHAAKAILVSRAVDIEASKIFVIPNAKDPQHFRPGTAEQRLSARKRLGVPPDAPLLMYTGSLGPQYLPERMLDLFEALRQRDPRTHFVCFTFQEAWLDEAFRRRGLSRDNVYIGRGEPDQIAASLPAADLGVALRQVSFSQRAISPIKVAEYLQSGVPVVSSPVGDLASQLDDSIAYMLQDTAADTEGVVHWFFDRALADRERLRQRCREVGERLFGVDQCAGAYRRAFELARG